MKLWQKGYKLNEEIEKFTVGNDYLLDHKLVKYDCVASIAHAKALQKAKILTKKELDKLTTELNQIIKLDSNGKFIINQEDEDCHTAIEKHLTKKLNQLGKKIHTGRSRNDQVLTAIRLYEKEELKQIKILIFKLNEALITLIKKYGQVDFPGYTHMQKAMPTKVGIWLGQFVSGMQDNLILLKAVEKIIDKSPLGSAAGFGVPVFNINKTIATKELKFATVQKNPMYCQMSRGKFEGEIISFLGNIMFDLNKLSTDLILFSMKEFNYVELPKEFCTGSSIMPQKKNPDVLELIRAKYSIILGEEMKVKSLIGNLMSGYNRDLQLTKEPLFNSVDITKNCLKMITLVLNGLKINKKNCEEAMTKELFATEEAYKLVKKGMSFRDAYKEIGGKYNG